MQRQSQKNFFPRQALTAQSKTRITANVSAPLKTTSRTLNGLPQLTSTEEKDAIAKLKPQFKDLLVAVSDFISHNGSVPIFRNNLQKVLTDADRYFNGFYSQLSKSGGTTISITKVQPAKTTPMIKNTAIPFIKAWGLLMREIDIMHGKGIDFIQDAVDENFNQILNILENIQKGVGYDAGVHDVTIRKAKKMQQQVWTFQGQIAKFLGKTTEQKKEAEERLASALKTFSRDMSSAFSTEFSSVASSFPDNEKNRNLCYNCVCEVIFEVTGAVSFTPDIEKIGEAIDKISQIVENIATNLGISNLLVPPTPKNEGKEKKEIKSVLQQQIEQMTKKGKEETNEGESFFDRNLDITDIIDRGFIVFKRSSVPIDRVKEFFESVRYKISNLQKTNEEMSKELFQTKQKLTFSESYKERLTQETQKVATLRNSTNQLQERINALTEQLDTMRKKENIIGLRECLKKVNTRIRTAAELEEKQFDDDLSLINDTESLLFEQDALKCKKCQKNAVIFDKLQGLLGSAMYVEETQILVKNNASLQKNFEKMKAEKDLYLKEKGELTQAILKILEFFNVTPPGMIPLHEFCVQSVQEQVALLENKLTKEKGDHQADLDRIATKIETQLKVHKAASVDKQIEQLKIFRDSEANTMKQMKTHLEEVEQRLCGYLKVKKSGRPLFESIKALLTQLETNINPLQSVVESLKLELDEASVALNDAEKTVARIAKATIPEDDIKLTERIENLSKLLRTIE